MEFTQADYHVLQVVYYLIAKYDYQIVNVSTNSHNIYLVQTNQSEYPVVKVTKELVEDYHDNQDYQHHIQDMIQYLTHTTGKLLVVSVNALSKPSSFSDFEVIPLTVNQPLKNENPMIQSLDGLLTVSDNLEKDVRLLDLNIMRATRNQKKKEERKWKNIPKLTFSIAMICIVYFLAVLFLSMYTGKSIDSAIFLGAYYKMSVVAMDEYWRLFTAGFMHIDIFHLLVNLVALWSLGTMMERLVSKKNYLIILIGAILVGNLFVLIGDPNTVVVGISGGLYGLLGAFLVHIFMSGGMKNPRVRNSVLQVVFVNLLITFMPGISLMGHLGGLFFGVIAGFVLLAPSYHKALRINTLVAGSLALVLLVGMGLNVDRVDPIYGGNDANVIEIAEQFKLTNYADKMRVQFSKYYR